MSRTVSMSIPLRTRDSNRRWAKSRRPCSSTAEPMARDIPLVESVALKYLNPLSIWTMRDCSAPLFSVFSVETRRTSRKAALNRK